MSKILIIIGMLLCLNGLYLLTISNLTSGTFLTIFLGLFLLIWGIFYVKIGELTQNGVLKFVKIFVIILMCLEVLLVGFLTIYGHNDNVDYREDALIVLGAGIRGDKVTLTLKLRLDKAIEYHKKNPDALIVVTGGQGFQETVTEASAMEKYLLEQGVPKDVIVKEERATSTNENMRFSKQILDERFGGKYKVAVISNNFHIYRSVVIAKMEGFEDISHMHAGLQWYNIVQCYLRESLATLKMWVLG